MCTALQKKHDSVNIVGKSGKTWGAALRASESKVPVYVSQGHRVSLDTAIEIVKMTCGQAKIPEPIRQADLRGR